MKILSNKIEINNSEIKENVNNLEIKNNNIGFSLKLYNSRPEYNGNYISYLSDIPNPNIKRTLITSSNLLITSDFEYDVVILNSSYQIVEIDNYSLVDNQLIYIFAFNVWTLLATNVNVITPFNLVGHLLGPRSYKLFKIDSNTFFFD